MSRIFQRGNAQVQANLTPMIDVVFLLIVFFVLVSSIVEVEHEEMELPQPKNPATVKPGDEQRAVISVKPTGNDIRAEYYRLGGRTFSPDPTGLAALTEQLSTMFRANPALDVNVRADRLTHYEWIEPAIQAVSDAAVMVDPNLSPRVNLVVINDE